MVKSQHLFDRLKQKRAYEKFTKDNPDAFLYAVFCILSTNELEGDKIQFDFYLPKIEKIAYSEYPFDEITIQAQKSKLEAKQLNLANISLDIESIAETIKKIQTEKKDNCAITKTIGVLREGLWDFTCTTQTLDILRIKVNPQTEEIIDYKKENLTNFIQIKKAKKD